MIAISQTIAPIQLATIDVACAKPADPSDEYGANFLQTLVQMTKADSQISLTDPEIIERKDSTGAVSTDDDTETPVEDWLAEPISWLALTQPTVLVAIPDTTLVTSILMPQHNLEPEDEKILLDQNIALPTSATKILGFDAVFAEGFHLLETRMTLIIEAPIDDQTAAILAGPIVKNIASKEMFGLTEPLAADDTTWQPSPPVSSKNATGTSELVPVSPPTQGAVDSQLLSDTALAGAELKVHLASLAERQTSAEMRPPATVSKHEEGKKPEQKEQRPTAAEMIWRQKWSSGASDTTSKALPTITSIVTSQTAPSQMQLTASSTNFASVTWHQNASNGPDSLPQNDLVKSPVRPHMAIPTPPVDQLNLIAA